MLRWPVLTERKDAVMRIGKLIRDVVILAIVVFTVGGITLWMLNLAADRGGL
jgi:hypothetical protein